MTVTFDASARALLDPATLARWETVSLPRFAANWPVGKVGAVLLGTHTFWLQRTGVDALRLAVDREDLVMVEPGKVDTSLSGVWRELHTGALVLETLEQREQLVQRVTQRVPPCCMGHWRTWLRDHPFDYTSREAFFVGTVEAHNAVSGRLGKPVLTVAEALALYSNP